MQFNMSILTILAVIFGITTACFITNCPPGGKRSIIADEHSQKMCTRCGPSGLGRCFGPDICCGEEIGCHFKNQITTICRTENISPRLCRNEGRTCNNGKGICAIDSVCCSTNGCFIEKQCIGERSKATGGKWHNLIDASIQFEDLK